MADDHPAVIRISQTNSAALRELVSKRQELDALQADIARLEKETGFRGRVEIVARCLEMPESAARRLGVQTEQGSRAASLTILDRDAMSRMETSLVPLHGVRTLALQHLAARNGEKAEMFSGEELPIQVPGQKGTGNAPPRRFGTRIEATPRSLGKGRVQVDFSVSLSERASKDGLTWRKEFIPSVQERRITASVELTLGETGVMMFPTAPVSSTSRGQAKSDSQHLPLLFLSVDEIDTHVAD
jgi:Flp pilus assembly secretin CpaC